MTDQPGLPVRPPYHRPLHPWAWPVGFTLLTIEANAQLENQAGAVRQPSLTIWVCDFCKCLVTEPDMHDEHVHNPGPPE